MSLLTSSCFALFSISFFILTLPLFFSFSASRFIFSSHFLFPPQRGSKPALFPAKHHVTINTFILSPRHPLNHCLVSENLLTCMKAPILANLRSTARSLHLCKRSLAEFLSLPVLLACSFFKFSDALTISAIRLDRWIKSVTSPNPILHRFRRSRVGRLTTRLGVGACTANCVEPRPSRLHTF